jgi:hypothetical protein
MSLRPSFKLSLPVVAVALLIAFAAWPGGPRVARADVDSVSPDAVLGENGDTVDVDIAGSGGTGVLSVTASGSSTLVTTDCDDTGGACGAPTAGDPVSWPTVDGPYTATVTVTLVCTDVTVVTVTATHASDSTPVAQIVCVPDDVGTIVVEKQSDDDNDFNFDWDADGTCAVVVNGTVDVDDAGTFDLEDNDEAQFFCDDTVDTLVVDEDDVSNFTEINDCSESSEGVADISGSTVTFAVDELESNDTVQCTWDNFGGAEATATAAAGPVTSVTVTAANITSCGGTTAVQVTLRNASGGPAPAGTSVTATSSAGGTFLPSSTLTANFPFSFATFIYQAPATFSGIAAITVRTNNNVAGSVNIQVVCGATVAPTASATAGPLRPPSAGDGGLLGGSGGGSGFGPYLPSTLAAAAAALVLGITLAARRWSTIASPVAHVAQHARATSARSNSRGGFALASLALIGLALFRKRNRQQLVSSSTRRRL